MATEEQANSVLPPGWNRAVVNGAPVVLGPWRTFDFGQDLRLKPSVDVWNPGPKVDTRGLREENVETLMLLNLDRLFSGYQMALCGKSLRDWSGADIEATDPSGVRHLFEVKYGAPASHVIDQALSYALDTVASAAEMPKHFHQQDAADRHRFLACRIAGFWTGTRADKWPRDTKMAPAARDWAAMRVVLADHPEVGLDESACRELSGQLEESWQEMPVLPTCLSGVHFHLAVPDPARIGENQLYALGRLRWRGHRASVWQVAAFVEGERGQFSIRECWVPPTDTSRKRWHPPKGVGPVGCRVGELLAAMAAIDPSLFRRAPLSERGRGETVVLGHGWHGDFPAVIIDCKEVETGPRVRIEAWVINPKSLDAVHGAGAKRIRQLRFETIAEWVLSIAPPEDPGVADRVRGLKKKPESWTTTDAETGLDLRSWHSGGLKVARIELPASNLQAAASVAVRAVRHVLREANSRSDGFGPDVVGL